MIIFVSPYFQMNTWPVFTCRYLTHTSQSCQMIRPSTWASANTDPSNQTITGINFSLSHRQTLTHILTFNVSDLFFVFCCNRYWCFVHKIDGQTLFRKAAVKTGALTPSTVWSFTECIWSNSILRLTFLYSYVLYTVPDCHIVHSNQNLISMMS